MKSLAKRALEILWQEKKWWIIPLIVLALILGAALYFTQGSDPISPYMYSR